jgi:hypothetical protein
MIPFINMQYGWATLFSASSDDGKCTPGLMILARLSPFLLADSNFLPATKEVIVVRLHKSGPHTLSNGQKIASDETVVEKKQPKNPQVAELVAVKHS